MNTHIQAVWTHLVQATAFGCVVATLLLILPMQSARWNRLLGWAAMLRFVFPLGLMAAVLPWGVARNFNWLSPLLISAEANDQIGTTAAAVSWWPAVLATWLLGVVAVAIHMSVRSRKVARLLRAARQPFPEKHRRQLHCLAARVGLDFDTVTGWTTEANVSPGVAGFFRSRVHVPRELLHNLSPEECEAVFLHELMHVVRKDNLVRMVQTMVVCLCWFHPLVWWLHRRMLFESERACDEAVVRLTGNKETYVQGVFKSARYTLGLDVPGFAGMARSGLNVRFAALLKPNQRKDRPMLRFACLLFMVGGLVLTSGAANSDQAAAYEVYQIDQPPQPIHHVRPAYPDGLREAGVTGMVLVECMVDDTGAVQAATAVQSTRPEFEQSAIDAVREWRFTPGIKAGQPVACLLRIPIIYRIGKNPEGFNISGSKPVH